MAKQTAQSSLYAKYGAKLASSVEKHKNDETKISSGGDLPIGIEGGVAKLTKCGFALYKDDVKTKELKGEFYFLAQAVVLTPESFTDGEGNTQKVAGRLTRIGPEPVCDTLMRNGKAVTKRKNGRYTMDDHVAWILNELRKLGVDTKLLKGELLEAAAAAAEKSKVCLEFRTWGFDPQEIINRGGKWFVVQKGKDVAGPYPTEQALKVANEYAGSEPRCNHDWRGVTAEPVIADDGMKDNTATGSAPAASVEVHGEVAGDPTGSVEANTIVDYSTETDLTVLGQAADGSDETTAEAARARLGELAVAAGLSVEDDSPFGQSDNFVAAAELIREAQISAGASAVVGGEQDWVALASDAEGTDNAKSDAAIELLRSGWEASGKTCDDAFEAMSWGDVAAALSQGSAAAGPVEHKVGHVIFYKPTGKNPRTKKPWADKNGKPYEKAIECEILAIDGDKFTLKSYDDGVSEFKNVPLAEIQTSN